MPSYVSEKLLGYISGFSVVASQLSGFESPNIREAIANREYTNHQTQMQNAQQIVDFLSGNAIGGGVPDKETTVGFYTWMKREVKALYANSFQLAFEVAKKAERALQNELGDPSLSYIGFSYLDGIEGLLAGEKLLFDVKTMEMAYHDLNQREYELTKHVSLLQVAPLALVQLRATGSCLFTLPEELFDLDGPGHYFRRIRSIGVTLPCVAGPFTSANCTLTLQKSSIRTTADLGTGYSREDFKRFGALRGFLHRGLFDACRHARRHRHIPVANGRHRITLNGYRLMRSASALRRTGSSPPPRTIDALVAGRPVNHANRPLQTDRNLLSHFVFRDSLTSPTKTQCVHD